jgi:hypothetical protein
MAGPLGTIFKTQCLCPVHLLHEFAIEPLIENYTLGMTKEMTRMRPVI